MTFECEMVKDAIYTVISKIDEKPYIIHRETDIQAMIYNELCKKEKKYYTISINCNEYETSLVHCEYYFGKNRQGKHDRKRFDIVIFDEEEVKYINNNWLTISQEKSGQWDIVKLKHIIEIKAEFGLGGARYKKFNGSYVEEDVKKLLEFKELHRKDKSKNSFLHFVYIIRLLNASQGSKNDITKLIEVLDNYCKVSDVCCYHNSNYFLDKEIAVLKL